MTKTLPADLTNNSETTTSTTSKDDQKSLAELMFDMKHHLQSAANDLLQPRTEAIEQLLQKAKTLG